MPEFLRRLIGQGVKDAPPPFELALPDGWVGGYGGTRLIEALVEYARVHPESHEYVFELLLPTLEGTDDDLFLACTIREPYAELSVSAYAMDQEGLLTVDDELEAWVEGNLDVLTERGDQLVGDQNGLIIQEPYPGRELRWSQSSPDGPPLEVFSWCFVTAGHVWTIASSVGTIDFGATVDLTLTSEATLRAIAASFRVV